MMTNVGLGGGNAILQGFEFFNIGMVRHDLNRFYNDTVIFALLDMKFHARLCIIMSRLHSNGQEGSTHCASNALSGRSCQKYKVHGLDTKDSPIKDVDSTNFPILKGF